MQNGKSGILMAPSVLSADFKRLAEDVEDVVRAGADVMHVDIMDGNFVPNISFGPGIVRALNDITDLPLDVHLMIAEPSRYIEEFAAAGADYLTVHQEACPHLHRVLQQIKDTGANPGVALNPGTPCDTLAEVLPYLDQVLIMSVNPGFGGQSYIPSMTDKIAAARAMIDKTDHPVLLSVDGGINAQTAVPAARAGARLLVMGSYAFGAADRAAAIGDVRDACSKI